MQVCATLTGQPVNYSQIGRLAGVDSKTAKSWVSILVSSYIVKLVRPYSNNLLKRLNKQPLMHFTDTGLASYLAGWRGVTALSRGQMSGHILETYAYGEIYKSYINTGSVAPDLYFLRTSDQKEIDLLLQENGKLHPIEIKRASLVNGSAIKNFSVLDSVTGDNMPVNRGFGCVLCLNDEPYPITSNTWGFPVWGI
jgi:uncharacterized protein